MQWLAILSALLPLLEMLLKWLSGLKSRNAMSPLAQHKLLLVLNRMRAVVGESKKVGFDIESQEVMEASDE